LGAFTHLCTDRAQKKHARQKSGIDFFYRVRNPAQNRNNPKEHDHSGRTTPLPCEGRSQSKNTHKNKTLKAKTTRPGKKEGAHGTKRAHSCDILAPSRLSGLTRQRLTG
jgi:hypothetical protein